jgi:hypothetical protein
MSKKKTTKKKQSQVEKDNARVPRDWENDPAWLRDLLRRTWQELPDDLSLVFDMDDDETRERVELLSGQVGYVLAEPDDAMNAEDSEREAAAHRGES